MISFSMNPIRESITVVKEDKVCPWSLIPSIDRRDLGAVTPPRKYYTSTTPSHLRITKVPIK